MPDPKSDAGSPSTSFGDRKATIYVSTKKYEAKQVTVRLGHTPPYTKMFFVSFKPKGARTRSFLGDAAYGRTVILDGWGHPEFDWLLRSVAEAPRVEMGPGVSVKTVSYTVQRGGDQSKDKYELEFEQYLKDLDPAKILFNNRESAASEA